MNHRIAFYITISFIGSVVLSQRSRNEDPGHTISEEEESQYCEHEYSIQSFFERLLRNYDKNLLPNEDGNTVELEVHVQEISEVSESRSDFTVDIFISEIWYDPRLTFDFLDVCRSNITIKTEYKSKIWTPDTCVMNSKQAALHKSPSDNAFFIIYSDGKIWQNHRMHIRGPCEIDLRAFPFDTQRCSITFETNSYNFQEVKLKWYTKPVTLFWHGHLPDFYLKGTALHKSLIPYPNGMWDQLELSFVFKRKVGYYLFQAYFPTSLTVIVSWITFYLESKALSARVTLSVSSLLALTFQFGNVLSHLPRVSYVKYIDVWMIACCIFVFASMVEMAATCQCTRRQTRLKVGKKSGPIDTRWMEMKLVGKKELEGEVFGGTGSKNKAVRQSFWPSLKSRFWSPWQKPDKKHLHSKAEEEQFMAIHNKVTDEVIIMAVEEDQPAQPPDLKIGDIFKGTLGNKARGSVMVEYMPALDPTLRKSIHFDTTASSPDEETDGGKVGRAASCFRLIRQWANAWSQYRLTADRLDRISRVLFPVAFLLFNLFYWTVYFMSLR